MKFILLLQSLIIFAGVAYWYAVLRVSDGGQVTRPVIDVAESLVLPPKASPQVVPTTQQEEEFVQGTGTVLYDPEGSSDAGMEFPVMEVEPQL